MGLGLKPPTTCVLSPTDIDNGACRREQQRAEARLTHADKITLDSVRLISSCAGGRPAESDLEQRVEVAAGGGRPQRCVVVLLEAPFSPRAPGGAQHAVCIGDMAATGMQHYDPEISGRECSAI